MFNGGAISILGLGFFLGLKHALDADHLVAVSTIVSTPYCHFERSEKSGRSREEKLHYSRISLMGRGFWSSSLVGALWGLGHTASLLVVGLVVIIFNFQIPSKIALAMEFAVAVMLIALGGNVLWKIFRGATFHIHAHRHEGHLHIHPHFHKPVEHQSDELTTPLDHAFHSELSTCHFEQSEKSGRGGAGELRHHHSVPIGKKPFFVGMVHGLAGSAALMFLVLATISSRPLALAYIGIFGFGSVAGMFLMSALIGLPFSFTSKYARAHQIIRTTAGVASVGFGLFLAYRIGMVEGLFL